MSAFRSTFVSHAHADNDLCDRYVNALRARGIDVWYDRNNAQAGHFLDREIEEQLEQRSSFVLLMTQQALDSYWVQQELGAYRGLIARERSRLLLPVRIGPCSVPTLLNALLWIDALTMPFDQAIDAIATALTAQGAATIQPTSTPPRDTLPPLGPAPAPADSAPAHHLTPMPLYNLGFRGYTINGVECILPPLCPISAGVFTMGSDKSHDKEANDNETPQYPVEVEAFAMGQHPVTVAEYVCAVRSKAVREPTQYEYSGKKYGPDWATQQTHPDHPVVCVSWNDAMAYVTWLAKLTGQIWHLPTEAEWEKAARGTDGRLYPWGDTFDKARCNTRESGIGTKTPVGRYLTGASPYHVQDMTGSVWEWTSSLFQMYPYRENDGRENRDSSDHRVLRGGSWYNDQRGARAAYRDRSWPVYISLDAGFRLAWSLVQHNGVGG